MDKWINNISIGCDVFSFIKEWNSGTCYNMDESQKPYAKWNKTDTKRQILYDSTHMRYLKYKIVEFMEKESRIVVPGAGGWGECGVTV